MWFLDAQYLPWLIILGGLFIGTFARWAVMQSLNQRVDGRQIRIDAMVLLMNGLLAAQFAETFGLTGTKLGVAAAMFGASSTLLFAKLHAAFMSRVSRAELFIGPNEEAAIPAKAPDIEVHSIGPGSPQTVAEVVIEALRDPSGKQFDESFRRMKDIE